MTSPPAQDSVLLSRLDAEGPSASTGTQDDADAWVGHMVAVVIVLGLALRVLLQPFSGLTYNESYVVVLSRHLSMGYVDHPPLAMWLAAAARWLFGSEANIAVRAPAMLLFAGTTWLTYLVGRDLFSARAGLYAAIALNLSPLFSLFIGAYAVTDGPMLFCVVLAAYLLERALFTAPERWASPLWIGAGTATGFGMLSKYTAVWLPVGAALFLLSHPDYRRWLRHPGPYMAAAAALAVFSPVLWWNADNQWISLAFQGNRALPESGLKLGRLLAYLGIVAAYLLPWIWCALVVVLVAALRTGRHDAARWFLACLGLPPILFFTLVRLVGNASDKGYHWPAPGYALLFPLLGAAIVVWQARFPGHVRRAAIVSVGVLGAVVLGFASNSVSGWVRALHPQFERRDPFVTDHLNWDDLRNVLVARGMLAQTDFVAATHWRECAKVDYALGGRVPVLCLTPEPLHFSLIEDQAASRGRNGVLVGVNIWEEQVRARIGAHFDAVERLAPAMLGQFGRPRLELQLYAVRGFRADYPWPYGKVPR